MVSWAADENVKLQHEYPSISSGADPRKENFEPLFFREEEEQEQEECVGCVPGTTPISIAATKQVWTGTLTNTFLCGARIEECVCVCRLWSS